jgi:hypothetical protein
MIGSSGDWFSRKPRLTQGCSARRMDGLSTAAFDILV